MHDPLIESVGDLLAVDPGLNKPAAALFRGGVLVAAERVRVDPEWAALDVGDRVNRIAGEIARWGMARNMEPRAFAWERPRVYDKKKSKADPDDLIALAMVAAALGGMLSVALAPRSIALRIVTREPREIWGQLPKATEGDPWASLRGERIASRLSATERAACQSSHDAVDAAGIGLFMLGRFERRRVFSGATRS